MLIVIFYFQYPVFCSQPNTPITTTLRLSNKGGSSGGLAVEVKKKAVSTPPSNKYTRKSQRGNKLFPDRGQDTNGLVVAGKTVDPGLDENETELGVLVLAVALKVLSDGDGLLDQHVQVLWDLGGEAFFFYKTISLCQSQ